ncbi:MAG TPA: DNA methyltransferase [Conexibacter sp.]|nr:DNA methyltransferase [Conexibacter sp.]
MIQDAPVTLRVTPSTAGDPTALLEALLEQASHQDEPLRVNFRALMPAVSATERSTHLMHPYPGKLLRQIPALFAGADQLSRPGDAVLDPFCGSGTVLLETQMAGRRAIGCDTNPLACLISAAKTTPLAPARVEHACRRVVRAARDGESELSVAALAHVGRWYYPQMLAPLAALRAAVARMTDPELRRFFEVCFSATARAVSLADPRVPVPVLLNPQRYREDHWLHGHASRRLEELRTADVAEVFRQTVAANLARLSCLDTAAPDVVVLDGDARELPARLGAAGRQHVDLVITSPPYLGAQKYVRASSLGLRWLDLVPDGELQQLARRSIGREHFKQSEYDEHVSCGLPAADALIDAVRPSNPLRAHLASVYIREMRDAVSGMWSVLRPGGHAVLVAGGNRLCGRSFPTPRYLEQLAHEQGFVTRMTLLDRIRSRGLMTRRNGSSGLIAEECVLLLEKPA